jgi:hypothetical protein
MAGGWMVMGMLRRGAAGLLAAAAMAAAGGACAAETPATLPPSAPMSYDDCLREIGATAGRLGVPPEVIEDRAGLHVVRFTTPAGRVVLGCSIDAGYLAVATRS